MSGSISRGRMAHYGGEAAEQQIARDYERRGYVVACRRWRGAGGEIDLIARNGDEIVFVEVKKSRTRQGAAERINRRQIARIQASAQEFLEGEPMGQLTPMRFDVALVDANGVFEIVENAFGHD
ncbi:YraN family protein [Rhodobacteraceae bacterium F11138]|nr:YraN family protein [Rhodobacteraceae bacterium F11138]